MFECRVGCHCRRRRRRAGFSLIELIVVLGIISVLLGGVVVAIRIGLEHRDESQTQMTIQKARMTIESWKLAYDQYPPSGMTRMAGIADPNSFQIYSMGEDGIPNTDDDVVP